MKNGTEVLLMKKLIAAVLAAIMALSFAACGGKTEESSAPADSSSSSSSSSKTSSEASSEADTSSSEAETTGAESQTSSAQSADDLKYGEMAIINDKSGFKLDGIRLLGNQHDGDIMSIPFSTDFKDIQYEFFLNEWISFYFKTESDISDNPAKIHILAIPHRSLEELKKSTFDELLTEAMEKGFVIDVSGYIHEGEGEGYVGDNYINGDYPAGDYDIVITHKGTLCYCLKIKLDKS